jgi:hypothetical protein
VAGSPVSYLDIRQSEQSGIAPWVPFIIAFGLIALVISVLIVVNVVGGAVVAGTTRIGVLKSIGFTPLQIVASYVLLPAVPAVTGAVIVAAGGRPGVAGRSDVPGAGDRHRPRPEAEARIRRPAAPGPADRHAPPGHPRLRLARGPAGPHLRHGGRPASGRPPARPKHTARNPGNG